MSPLSKPNLLLATLLAGAAALAIAADPLPYNLERAIEAQNQLTSERPEDPAVWNDLGNLLTLKRHFDKAEVSYRKAIALDPEPVAPHFNLALLLERRGEHRAAFKQLREVIEREPEHAWAHYQLGVIYQRWRLDSLAVRSYARAFRFDPSLADAATNPHVLDNELLARALLRAHGGEAEALLPPRTYEEPGRIAALMIDVPQPASGARDETTTAAGGGIRPGASGGPVRFPAEDEPAASEEEPKRLTTRDLEPGREVNQVGGSAGAAGGTTAAPQRATPPGGAVRTTRPFTGRVRPGEDPGDTSAPPPSGLGPRKFTPAPDSTGRLELRLLPPVVASAG